MKVEIELHDPEYAIQILETLSKYAEPHSARKNLLENLTDQLRKGMPKPEPMGIGAVVKDGTHGDILVRTLPAQAIEPWYSPSYGTWYSWGQISQPEVFSEGVEVKDD